MVKLTLNRRTTKWRPDITSYSMILDILAAENAPKEVFIMKRTKNFVNDQFEDVFAAVATPVQLEDFPIGAPDANSSYYRVSSVELIARTAEGMNAIFDSMIYELNKLSLDIDALKNGLRDEKQYIISSGADTYSTNHIMSSGGIGALTAIQVLSIVEGTIVETSDGNVWAYTGTGSKLLQSSYIQLENAAEATNGTNIEVGTLYFCNVR